jgi:hypothetical protein
VIRDWDDREVGRVTTDVSDVTEAPGGTIWHGGAHRVTITSNLRGKLRSKTFIGETAWSRAARLQEDAAVQLRRAMMESR